MSTYHFKTKPYRHQVKALKKALKRGSCALFMEMGTGKTKVAIDFACALCVKYERNLRVLVVCPLSVTGVWPLEIEKHAPAGPFPPSWKIINYDKARRAEVREELLEWKPDIVICDEGHRIKNPQSQQSKAMYRIGMHVQHRLLLTGTPVGKSLLDLFAQFRFVHTRIFGTVWKDFKERYAIFGGFGGYELKKYKRKREVVRKITPYTVRVKKKDCLDLPPASHELVPVELTDSAELYEQFARESVAQIEAGTLVVDNVLARMQKLSQITGGYVKIDDKWVRVGEEKATYLEDQLEDMWGSGVKKLAIFCHYIPELKAIHKRAAGVGYRVLPYWGKTKPEMRERILADFDETKKPTVFLGTIGTGSLGIDLTAANHCIFYSHTDSFIDFRQTCDRFHRIGQHNPVTYYHYVARHPKFTTIDHGRLIALKRKRKTEDLVMTHPRLLLMGGAE